jgi:hypothetical protein
LGDNRAQQNCICIPKMIDSYQGRSYFGKILQAADLYIHKQKLEQLEEAAYELTKESAFQS